MRKGNLPWYRYILPQLLVWITGESRYLPKIEWADQSWVHNIFRFYELLFWRKQGIRAEATTIATKSLEGKVTVFHYYHTFEAACAGVETYIRQLIKVPKFVPVKIYVPAFNNGMIGFPQMSSPYLFAIAFDAAAQTSGNPVTSITFSLTTAGSDRYITVGCATNGDGTEIPNQTSVTYSAVGLTGLVNASTGSGNFAPLKQWGLHAPATGANDVVFTHGNSRRLAAIAISYTGAQQTTAVAATGVNTSGGTSTTLSITTTVNDSWLVGFCGDNSAPSAGTGATARGSTVEGMGGFDSNAALAAGANTMQATHGDSPAAEQVFIGIELKRATVSSISSSISSSPSSSISSSPSSSISTSPSSSISSSPSTSISSSISTSPSSSISTSPSSSVSPSTSISSSISTSPSSSISTSPSTSISSSPSSSISTSPSSSVSSSPSTSISTSPSSSVSTSISTSPSSSISSSPSSSISSSPSSSRSSSISSSPSSSPSPSAPYGIIIGRNNTTNRLVGTNLTRQQKV